MLFPSSGYFVIVKEACDLANKHTSLVGGWRVRKRWIRTLFSFGVILLICESFGRFVCVFYPSLHLKRNAGCAIRTGGVDRRKEGDVCSQTHFAEESELT